MKATFRTARALARLLGVVAVGAGCSSLTDIDAPGVVQPDAVDNPVGAVARYAGATRLFVTALAGQVGTITSVGLITDELVSGNQPNNAGGIEPDQRRLPETYTQFSGYQGLHAARVNLAAAADALKKFAPTPASRIGQMLALTGYVELSLGENFCAGVPFSTVTPEGEQYGQPTTTAEVFGRALAHFDSAATFAADSARVLNMVRVGRGRTLLDLGRYADAAAAVAAVPTSFVYTLDISTTVATQNNALFNIMNSANGAGVGDREGINGLNFRTAADPRVPTVFFRRAADNVTDLYRFTPISSTASPIALATGVEARLIEAEAALQANRNDASPAGPGWLGILNTLRATAITPGLPALADPGSFDARVNLLFRERAFWMYLTGHRLGDMRRLVKQYGRPTESVFPTGTYKDGLPYGPHVNFPLGTSDGQNPFFRGCTDRAA
jgi:starch-binding outer membrane protein, SusD/RagB family